MKFIDLERQYIGIKDIVNTGIKNVIESQHYIMGPEIEELEIKLAHFVGRKYCLTCGSGTEALQIPLMSYELKKSDAVFVPTFTFFASAESISIAGGTPVFVDSNETFNMDPNSLRREVERVIKEGVLTPRGIVVVDLFGRSADYDLIVPIAEEYELFLIEDAAQGFGGKLREKRNGSFGNVSATSFFPAKPLGCYGDGGAIFTDDDRLYNIMRSIRVHGQGNNKYNNVRLGINGRMDTIQAAVLLAKLTIFEEELEARQTVVKWYEEYLDRILKTPLNDDEHFSAWAQYTVMAESKEQRDKLVTELNNKKIPVMVYYPIPLHRQIAYKGCGYEKIRLPYSEVIANRVLSLPMHPYLEKEEVEVICDAIKEII